MKFHWFDADFFNGNYPICGRAPSYSDKALDISQITCKWCLKKIPMVEAENTK